MFFYSFQDGGRQVLEASDVSEETLVTSPDIHVLSTQVCGLCQNRNATLTSSEVNVSL